MPTAGRPAEAGLAPGERIGPYQLETLLGRGLMGIVYLARHKPESESVALKVLRDELAKDELYRRRFQREARIASELDHQHVIPVIDFGEASGRLYIASRYIQGVSLAERIAEAGPLSREELLRLASELSRALDALHVRGLVHRDVKPANVMMDELGVSRLTDFGLARGEADTVLTKSGFVVGTVDYLAPEVIRGQKASRSSDVYAFGCLLYECLAGAPPFAGRSFVDTLVAHVGHEPPDLKVHRNDLPEPVSWAIVRALAKDPAARPKTATAYARIVRASAAPG
jgi:serine/threonine protein kinase